MEGLRKLEAGSQRSARTGSCNRQCTRGARGAYSFTSSFNLKDDWVLGLGSSGGESPAVSLANSLAFHLPLNASTIAPSARNPAVSASQCRLYGAPGRVVGVWEGLGHATTGLLEAGVGVGVGVGGVEAVERYL